MIQIKARRIEVREAAETIKEKNVKNRRIKMGQEKQLSKVCKYEQYER